MQNVRINDMKLRLLTNKKILGIDNGCVVNINDVCSTKCVPPTDRPISTAYICSKCALTALTECLRLELAQNESNIKVIASIF